ncbi:hypothetical protein HAX54_009822 [Datura stramonium]|uniref:Uncharacterized protein n=1 Tax=Datura stramonium TaxID=4076 RepID=A0ABS8WXK6_DATST|nr:hypothetical protein [Datura stramonium]
MGSPSGDTKGKPLPQDVPPNGTKPNERGEGEKNSYANTLIDNPSSSAASLEQQLIKARRNFHNGMHAVIFKTRDYYRFMASQCLPFHMHNWHFMKQIVSHVGTPLELDIATKSMNIPSIAREEQNVGQHNNRDNSEKVPEPGKAVNNMAEVPRQNRTEETTDQGTRKAGTNNEGKDVANNKRVMINDPNDLQVVLYEGERQEVTNKKKKSESDKSNRKGTEKKGSNQIQQESNAPITQNSFDELMVEEEY